MISEMYCVLSELGFTDNGKQNVLSQLCNCSLLTITGLDVSGYHLEVEYPSHLKQVSDALECRHRLNAMKREIKLCQKAVARQRSRANKKKTMGVHGNQVSITNDITELTFNKTSKNRI
jgi:hypothetical protein